MTISMQSASLTKITITHFFLLFAILCSIQPSKAEESVTQIGPRSFSLSAVHQESGDSTNQDIGGIAVGMLPPASFQGPEAFSGGVVSGRSQQAKKIAAALPAPMSLEEDRPNSYLQEYQVDWAPWVAKFAAHWYQNLRGTEELFGLCFQTPRPALIQFTCYADGHIGNVILKQSSGIIAYDRIQIVSLAHVQPLPPFPQGTQRKSITLLQGWESHCKKPGEEDFQPWNFATKYPREKVMRWQQKR